MQILFYPNLKEASRIQINMTHDRRRFKFKMLNFQNLKTKLKKYASYIEDINIYEKVDDFQILTFHGNECK